MSDQCGHCFICGQTGHFSRGCRGQKKFTVKPDNNKTIETVTPPSLFTTSQTEPYDEVHELLCERIRQLERSEDTGQIVGATYASHLSLRRQAKLKALIGKKCMVDCSFEGVATQALWDTVSQVTIVNDRWRKAFSHTFSYAASMNC